MIISKGVTRRGKPIPGIYVSPKQNEIVTPLRLEKVQTDLFALKRFKKKISKSPGNLVKKTVIKIKHYDVVIPELRSRHVRKN